MDKANPEITHFMLTSIYIKWLKKQVKKKGDKKNNRK